MKAGEGEGGNTQRPPFFGGFRKAAEGGRTWNLGKVLDISVAVFQMFHSVRFPTDWETKNVELGVKMLFSSIQMTSDETPNVTILEKQTTSAMWRYIFGERLREHKERKKHNLG